MGGEIDYASFCRLECYEKLKKNRLTTVLGILYAFFTTYW